MQSRSASWAAVVNQASPSLLPNWTFQPEVRRKKFKLKKERNSELAYDMIVYMEIHIYRKALITKQI